MKGNLFRPRRARPFFCKLAEATKEFPRLRQTGCGFSQKLAVDFHQDVVAGMFPIHLSIAFALDISARKGIAG
jgi:hypothetical protein